MPTRDPNDWMWGNALAMLANAERLHQQIFQPTGGPARRPVWAPPVDVVENAKEVLIIAALPGVAESAVELHLDGACLVIAGERITPPGFKDAAIHRMELPQGRFERRVPLPAGRYDQISRRTENGCLVVTLRKTA
jgi:HSP20 family molecular chaperone IbpA